MAVTTEVIPQTTVPAGRWAADPLHSSISFRVRNMGIVTVTGYFADFAGSLVSDGTLEGTHAEGTVEVPSISTRSDKRDQHLLADDFFAADKHPEIAFRSTAVRQNGEQVEVEGDLTIKGITNHVVAKGTLTGPATGLAGNTVVGLALETVIDRTQYGLTWNADLPSGGPVLANDVKIVVEAELAKVEA